MAPRLSPCSGPSPCPLAPVACSQLALCVYPAHVSRFELVDKFSLDRVQESSSELCPDSPPKDPQGYTHKSGNNNLNLGGTMAGGRLFFLPQPQEVRPHPPSPSQDQGWESGGQNSASASISGNSSQERAITRPPETLSTCLCSPASASLSH